MFAAAVRKRQNEWCTASDFCLQADGTALCASVFGKDAQKLQCFCAVQVPYEVPLETDNSRAWVLVYSRPISASDEPMHADDLMFPFQLPLYPTRPLVFVAFRAATNALHPPITLAWPCVQPVARYVLDHTAFLLCMEEWHKAVHAKHVRTLLSSSFDSFWELDDDSHLKSLGDKDCFLDEADEDTESILNATAKQECVSVTSKNNTTAISELQFESGDESSDDSDTEGNLSDDIFIADGGESEEEYEYPDDDDESENEAETSSDESADIADNT
jgi:hypothetical protein